MNLFDNLKKSLSEIVLSIAKDEKITLVQEKLNIFSVEPCKDKAHGDMATNIAMVLCKEFGLAPKILATKIVDRLKNNQDIAKVEIAGSGFINFVFANRFWYNFIIHILSQRDYSLPKMSDGEKINLEYASPNPTGPMHVGHTRGAIYGDVLANLLAKTGYDVTREYYINDAGSQIMTLVKSAYLRYLEALGEKIEIPEGLYPGDYLKSVGEKLKNKYGLELKSLSEDQYIVTIRDFVVGVMMEMVIKDLADLGIKHDRFFSEKKELHDTGKIDEAIKILEQKGLIYRGTIPLPKGEKNPDDYEEKEQTLFRSTLFGDDLDRVVKKSDGTPTYLAADIAYALSKFERGAKKMIMPLGYDHAGYVKRLKAVVKAITNGQAEIEVILCQMVKFIKDGQPLKMSKRAGNFINVADVTKEVGADALRFTMLSRKNDAPFDFDLAKVLEQSKDNPIFYVQYAHARCCSILRNSGVDFSDFKIDLSVLSNLKHESEIDLIKKLANYPRIIEMSVINFEPHRIVFYLQDLAGSFHSLWNKGNEDHSLKFIVIDDQDLTRARLCLILAISKIIASALSIFNIKPLEEM